jgi:hydroxymethylbilane synthase
MLPPGGCVATGSVRRRAQLASLRPDLTFASLRGNIATRLEKASDFDAILVAAAALERLGLRARASEVLEPSVMLPQAGQGAVAVECRESDRSTRERLRSIEHPATRRAVDAERAFLAAVGGDCDLPAGAWARGDTDGVLVLDALLASLDGHIVLRERRSGTDPEGLGRSLAGHILERAGGAALLSAYGPADDQP